MCRAICLSLVMLCWSTSLQAEDRPGEREDRINRPVEKNSDRVHETRDAVQGLIDRSAERIDSAQQMSRQIADCLLIHNQGEINLAKFALEHAQDDRVKEFARMMIRDHEEFGQKLHQFAAHGDLILGRTGTDQQKRTTSVPTTTTLPQTNPPVTAEPEHRQPAVQESPALTVEGKRGNRIEVHASKVVSDFQAEDWFQLEQTAAQKCEQLTKDSLSKKSGAEFDKAYAGCQVGMHIGMLAQLQAADRYVSGDLQNILKDAQGTVQNHLTKAEDLCHDLASPRTVSEK